mgnify:CR=1 FL=1
MVFYFDSSAISNLEKNPIDNIHSWHKGITNPIHGLMK